MSWKRSKDGGLDYDVTTELKYRKTKEKLFNDDTDERPKASWLIVSPEVAKELEPHIKNQRLEQIRGRVTSKLSIKEKLKQRIKEGSLRT